MGRYNPAEIEAVIKGYENWLVPGMQVRSLKDFADNTGHYSHIAALAKGTVLTIIEVQEHFAFPKWFGIRSKERPDACFAVVSGSEESNLSGPYVANFEPVEN